jgi:hypothetical protein
MEVLSPEKEKRKKKVKLGQRERSPAISADVFSGNSTSKMLKHLVATKVAAKVAA